MAPKESKETSTPKESVKIDKWDGSAVKNAIDDAVKEALTKKLNYVENFTLIDGRLAMSGVAVAIALFALIWDYWNPFPESKPVLIFCVLSYFLLMGVLTLYTTYKEKGIFIVAIQRDPSGFNPDNVWEASSFLKKYDDKYNFHLSVRDGKTGKTRESRFVKSIANFIDSNGVVLNELIEPEIIKIHNSLLTDRKEK